MKRKIWSVILTVCMVLGMMPAMSVPVAASAMISYTVGETKISNNVAEPIASATGDGWTWAYSSTEGKGTLTLTDAYIRGADSSGRSYGAYLPADTTIVLNGDSTIAGGTADNKSCGISCDGALTIKDGDTGSLSAVGGESSNGDSMGLEVNDTLTINSGRVTGLGGTADNSSYGINAPTLEVNSSADVTGIAGTANLYASCGVYCNRSASVEGSLTAVGAYANDGRSYGIETFYSLNVSGGTVVAQGGKGTSNFSYGVCVHQYNATVTLTGGLLVASSDFQALNIAPTDGNNTLTPLTGAYDSSLAVYGNSETYTSNNIYNSTLNLSNSELAKSTWSNSNASSGWMWDADSSTLNLKNMIIVGTNETESGKGSFGIQGGKDISIVYEGVNVVCGGTSESGDSCGIMDEVSDEAGLSLSGGGTLVALGRQAGKSRFGIQLSNPEGKDTGSLKVISGKVIALGGDAGKSEGAGSCGLSASKKIQIVGGDVTAVGGAGSLSSGTAAGAGISVSSGQLVAVGGYASDTNGISAGVCSIGTTTFSGDANVVAAGDGYGVATYSGEDSADFQLGTSAANTVTLTAMGGNGAANDNGTTTVPAKCVRCDGGTRTTAGSAVRFRLVDPVIAVAHDGNEYTNYGDFAEGWNYAVDPSTNPATVKLLADWTATTTATATYGTSFGTGVGFGDGTDSGTGYILVPAGKTITLDLNGHNIDRHLSSAKDSGYVIDNKKGTLKIKDASTDTVTSQGMITGGYNSNPSLSVGGILNDTGGTLTLQGGRITGNKAISWGGGVRNAGTFTMTGGAISGNIANYDNDSDGGAGGVFINGSNFTMTGGEISGNYTCGSTHGGGVYVNNSTMKVGGTAKITGNVSDATFNSTDGTASGGVTDNVYLSSRDKIIKCLTGAEVLANGASIGVTTKYAPTDGSPVNVTGNNSADYSSYFHSDLTTCRIQNSGSNSTQVVQLAYAMTGIFGAKFYQPQLWDCQRSPAFPVAGRAFRLSGLKAPYDQNLKKVSFAAPASDYVTFNYADKAVSGLDEATWKRIVNSLKRYTGATAEQIRAAAVVKEVLHYGENQNQTKVLSDIGLVWALGDDGFLYTAMDGAFKYSGGVGTYVTFAAHKTGDSIIYTPDKMEPYTKDEINGKKLAPEDGTPTTPAAVTYQELIKVVDGSGTAVSGAAVTITKDDNTYPGTTDTNGYVQFTGLPEEDIDEATVQSGGFETLTYNPVDSPEAVLTYTNPGNAGNGSQQDKVTATVNYGTNGSDKIGGTVSCIGAGASTDEGYSLTKGDTARFIFKPDSGYKVSNVTWSISADTLTGGAADGYCSFTPTASGKLTVTFAPYDQKSIFDIHYTTAEVFDVQRSPAFPDTGDSSIRFSWLAQPYDTNLDHITLGTGEYIKFDKVSSVEKAGKTAEYTKSLRWWTDATKIGTAALVEENVYNADGKVKTLGTGLIWCYNDPSKGFLFTTMDGVLGDCGGVGSYVSFNALRYGSSVTQLTDSAEPLQWGATDPKGQPENPDGDTVDDTQEVTFDFAGKVLNESNKSAVASTAVILTWASQNYPATTDTNGRFVVSGLPYAKNGDYTAKINGTTFTGELPDLGGVENSQNRTASLTAPEIVFLLPSSGTTGTIAATHTITVTKTGSGSVSPAGTVQVSEGGSARIGFAPSSGYTLSEVKIDDGSANADAKTNGYYKFTDVTGDHTVAVTFTANSTPGPVNPPANVPDRIGGDDRYDTASKITEQAFPDGAIEAIVATGEDFPDALCAAGLAGLNSCPIVITNSDALNETSENLLKTLGTTNALVLGGTGAVSENVEEKLSTEVTTGGVNRIGGTDRIATALKIAKSAPFDKEGTAIVVNGSRAADALSIAPYAYSDKDPMFLTSADGTLDPESFAEASKYARILIVGGTGVVTVATEDALKAAVGAGNVTRLGGANRYETSAIVASTLFDSYVGTAFASGLDGSYTDALTGAVLCGQKDVPLILVSETASESSGILSDMKSAGVTAGDLFILGGTAAVSDDTVAAIVKALS